MQKSSFILVSLTAFSLSAQAAVNDVFPSDYIALPDGSLNLTYYLSHREQDGPYKHGHKLFDGRLNTNLAAIRISHHHQIGNDYTFAPIAVLSWANSESSDGVLSKLIGERASGLADLRLGGSFWIHQDRKNQQFAAISMIASLPTGSYQQDRILNIGENRWKWTLGGGLIWPLGDRWLIDAIPEVTWYGDNNDYKGNRKLEQDVSTALTGYLRFLITPQFQLITGAQINRGGATKINEVDQNNAPNNTRLSLGLLYLTPEKQQWQLRYSHDAAVDNGFLTADELTLRYALVY
jgi:hypothetical protein